MTASVAVVIPARNAAPTLAALLASLRPFIERGEVADVIVVDDHSTDATGALAEAHGARVIASPARGAGAARNAGWRSLTAPSIWFVDADCVVRDGALRPLLEQFEDDRVAAASGTYENLRPESLVATLIQEEIALRHGDSPRDVGHVATFGLLVRRTALKALGGFNEALLRGQDADFAYRARAAGWRLRQEPRSRFGHHHETSYVRYLAAQWTHGRWRIHLHRRHPQPLAGDGYASPLDHVQPPLALASVLALGLLAVPGLRLLALVPPLLLALAQVPLTARLCWRRRQPRMLLFAPFAFVRAFARAGGALRGVFEATPR